MNRESPTKKKKTPVLDSDDSSDDDIIGAVYDVHDGDDANGDDALKDDSSDDGDDANYDPDGEEGPMPIIGSWQPDGCRKEAGTSIGNPALDLDWGCPDNDNDGIQNSKDPCPWDPEISSGAFGQDCAIKSDPNINSDNKDENSLTANTELLTMMGGAILFLLALIFVAQVSKAAGKKKLVRDRAEERLVNEAFTEEEERRQELKAAIARAKNKKKEIHRDVG